MKYAVIATGGKQYKVEEGKEIELEKIKGEKDIVFDRVLLLVDDQKVMIGSPLVENAKVEALVSSQEKGEKLYIYKYKAKSRYRRKTGHRQPKTIVRIEKIAIS